MTVGKVFQYSCQINFIGKQLLLQIKALFGSFPFVPIAWRAFTPSECHNVRQWPPVCGALVRHRRGRPVRRYVLQSCQVCYWSNVCLDLGTSKNWGKLLDQMKETSEEQKEKNEPDSVKLQPVEGESNCYEPSGIFCEMEFDENTETRRGKDGGKCKLM